MECRLNAAFATPVDGAKLVRVFGVVNGVLTALRVLMTAVQMAVSPVSPTLVPLVLVLAPPRL